MKNIVKAAGVFALAAALLTGCSAFTDAEPTPTSTQTPVSGTITMPEGPTGGPATATPTPEPTATAAPFPMEGVNAQGKTRDAAAEAALLNFVGLGPNAVLDADGKTPALIVEEAEEFKPTSDFFINIVYAGCASATADSTATPPAELLQRVVNETAEALGHASGDDVMVKGYAPVIATGVALLCPDRFPPAPQG